METIEERALEITRIKYCHEYDCPNYEKNCKYTKSLCQEAKDVYADFVQIATEQDRIARQEERERCIEAAQDVYCDITCNTRCDIKNRCQIMYEIRKAMKGGDV